MKNIGFTLVELMIVVAIISVFVAMAIVGVHRYINKEQSHIQNNPTHTCQDTSRVVCDKDSGEVACVSPRTLQIKRENDCTVITCKCP